MTELTYFFRSFQKRIRSATEKQLAGDNQLHHKSHSQTDWNWFACDQNKAFLTSFDIWFKAATFSLSFILDERCQKDLCLVHACSALLFCLTKILGIFLKTQSTKLNAHERAFMRADQNYFLATRTTINTCELIKTTFWQSALPYLAS